VIRLEDMEFIKAILSNIEIYINKIDIRIFALVIDEDLENTKNNFIIYIKHKLIKTNKNAEKIKKI